MASPSTPVHPARYLALFLALLVGVYLLVFLTGDKQAKPKLGIDLQGGTRVTLTARTPDGSRPTQRGAEPGAADHRLPRQRARRVRVRGGDRRRQPGDHRAGQRRQRSPQPGPDGAAVHPPGDPRDRRPSSPSSQASRPGPAAGRRRPQASRGHRGQPAPPPEPRPTGRPQEQGAPAAPARQAPPARHAAPQPPAPQPRPYPQAAAAEPAPPPGTGPEADAQKDLAQRIADEKAWRQSTEQQIQFLALQFQATQCNEDDILAGNDDPNLPLVTCSTDHKQVYLLDKSIISGEQIKNASSGMDNQRGEYVVQVEFKPDAANTWADFTASHVGTQTAFTLDSQVVSAPQIQEAIPGGNTQITGQFNAETGARSWPTC